MSALRLVIVAATMVLCLGAAAGAVVRHVDVSDDGFNPPFIFVGYGDQVTWTLIDGQHSTTSDPSSAKSWDSGDLSLVGGEFTITIDPGNGPGPFPYHCTFDPTLTGVIEIFPTAPSEVDMFGNTHKDVGVAVSDTFSETLMVYNAGASGYDGCHITWPEVDFGTVVMAQHDPGRVISLYSFGVINFDSDQVLGILTFSPRAGDTVNVNADFSTYGAGDYTVTVYDDGATVYTASNVTQPIGLYHASWATSEVYLRMPLIPVLPYASENIGADVLVPIADEIVVDVDGIIATGDCVRILANGVFVSEDDFGVTHMLLATPDTDTIKVVGEQVGVWGNAHVAMGQALFASGSVGPSQLTMANIGVGGDDGVSVIRSDGFGRGLGVEWDPPDMTTPASFVELRAKGGINGDRTSNPLGVSRAQREAGNVAVTADFTALGAATFTVEVYNDDSLVLSSAGHSGTAAIVGEAPTGVCYDGVQIGAEKLVAWEWGGLYTFTVPGETSVPGDRLRIISEGASADVESLNAVGLHLSAIDEITIIREYSPVDTGFTFGLQHATLGQSTFTFGGGDVGPETLTVESIGSSGYDGVVVGLGQAEFGSFQFDLPDTGFLIPQSTLELVARDESGTAIASLGLEGGRADTLTVNIETYPSGPLTILLYDEDGLVVALSDPGPEMIFDYPYEDLTVTVPAVMHDDGQYRLGGTISGILDITFLLDGTPYVGRRLEILVDCVYDPATQPTSFVEITGTEIGSFTITNEQLGAFSTPCEVIGAALFAIDNVAPGQLTVDNIGFSGEDGLALDLTSDFTTAVDLSLARPDPPIPPGAFLDCSFIGSEDGLIGIAHDRRIVAGWQQRLDFSTIGATAQTVSVYLNDSLISTITGHTGPAAVAADPADEFLLEITASVPTGTYKWSQATTITVLGVDESAVTANALVITPEDPTVEVERLTRSEVLAKDIPEITLIDLSVASGASCCELRGDIDHGGAGPDIADLVALVNYMFNGGVAPDCPEEADINGDGAGPDIADLVALVNYMFNGGPPPAVCGPGAAVTEMRP